MSALPLLLLDHSIVSHEPFWPALNKLIAGRRAQLALSVWNLFEIGAGRDRAQQDSRLSFLESLSPIWVLERVTLQRQEVQRFLWELNFRVSAPPIEPTTKYLSVVDSYWSGGKTRIGLTPRQFIDGLDYNKLDKLKDLSPNALKTLQSVSHETFKSKQRELFKAWIRGLLPTRDPDNRPIKPNELEFLLDFCEQKRASFFAECRSLTVEDALGRARIASRNRKPRRSDGPDLQHAVVALAYGDLFLVRDGFARDCSRRAAKELGPQNVARIFESPADAVATVRP